MTTTVRTFTVTAPPQRVLDYLRDFGRAEEWDPGTVTCTRNDSGPVVVGSTWHNTSKIAGITTELTYELVQDGPDRVVFRGENDSATTLDTISVLPEGSGSEITYHAEVEMKGVAKLATPAVKLVFEKLGNDTEKQMTAVINNLPA